MVSKNRRCLYVLLFYVGCPIILSAQMTQEDLLQHIGTSFAPLPQEWVELSYSAAFPISFPLLLDTSVAKAESVLQLLTEKALHNSVKDQQHFLENLLSQALTKRPSLNYPIWRAASQFPKASFGTQAQQSILDQIKSQPQYLDKWLMLAGLATDDPWPIRLLLAERPTRNIQQAAKLALVRMGDQQQAQSLLRGIQRIPIHDDFVYDIAPLAIYTRDQTIIEYLVDIVIQDLGQCHPADAEIAGQISCAYRLVELLIPILKGFPLGSQAWESGAAQEQMEQARKWLQLNRKKLIVDRQFW